LEDALEQNSSPGEEDDQAAARLPGSGGRPASGVDWERVAEVLAAVNGIWAVPVLRHLATGVSRPTDLLMVINAESDNRLSSKILFETLGRLSAYGLVNRRQVNGWPRETHYSLTGTGHEILSEVSKLGAPSTGWWPSMDDDPSGIPGVDSSRPSPARVWNYTIGGKDHYAVDREAAAAVLAAMPSLAVTARLSRRFQAAAVERLVGLGVTQFLDIGTGLPAAGAVHEVAQRAAPESRVVYVDNDPQVASHARALLVSSPEGACSFLQTDAREPGKILAHAAETLDLTQPVAICLLMLLHFIADDDDPWGIVRRLMEGIRGDRYLVIAHAGTDHVDESAQAATEAYNSRSPVAIRSRSRQEVTRFFTNAGATMLEPGLVPLAEWWPAEAGGFQEVPGYAGIGWRPAAVTPTA
jgi:DNA-binding HxlR family transcriptional regulator